MVNKFDKFPDGAHEFLMCPRCGDGKNAFEPYCGYCFDRFICPDDYEFVYVETDKTDKKEIIQRTENYLLSKCEEQGWHKDFIFKEVKPAETHGEKTNYYFKVIWRDWVVKD